MFSDPLEPLTAITAAVRTPLHPIRGNVDIDWAAHSTHTSPSPQWLKALFGDNNIAGIPGEGSGDLVMISDQREVYVLG
ncbi:MAG: hypothetical protein NT074_08960 [Methanomicrobiales archaeon]|nr:hypothetical protein [Methanomicrobiales archaeon]